MPWTEGTGWKGSDTSEQAAQEIAPKAKIIRARVLAELHSHAFGLTADEIAERLGLHCLSVRPRLSELRDEGCVVDTGARKKAGAFGKNQIVWGLT